MRSAPSAIVVHRDLQRYSFPSSRLGNALWEGSSASQAGVSAGRSPVASVSIYERQRRGLTLLARLDRIAIRDALRRAIYAMRGGVSIANEGCRHVCSVDRACCGADPGTPPPGKQSFPPKCVPKPELGNDPESLRSENEDEDDSRHSPERPQRAFSPRARPPDRHSSFSPLSWTAASTSPGRLADFVISYPPTSALASAARGVER
jgi:hypothetical protein